MVQLLEDDKQIPRQLLRDPEFCSAVENEKWITIYDMIVWEADTDSQSADIVYWLIEELKCPIFPHKKMPYLHFKNLRIAKDTFVVPEGVEAIEFEAFYDAPFKHIILPDSLREIGDFAFQNRSWESIEIPATVREIGYRIFYGCFNLKKVIIRDSGAVKDGRMIRKYCEQEGIPYELK